MWLGQVHIIYIYTMSPNCIYNIILKKYIYRFNSYKLRMFVWEALKTDGTKTKNL